MKRSCSRPLPPKEILNLIKLLHLICIIKEIQGVKYQITPPGSNRTNLEHGSSIRQLASSTSQCYGGKAFFLTSEDTSTLKEIQQQVSGLYLDPDMNKLTIKKHRGFF